MPAQQLERGREKVAVMKMGGSLPANSSSAALVSTKTVENAGLLQPEFRPASHAASGHITTRQWVTVAVLVYVNLINYMDRLTLAGEVTTFFVSAELISAVVKAVEGHVCCQSNRVTSDQLLTIMPTIGPVAPISQIR